MAAYSEAVKSGLYAKKTGLVGKYDNVRRYWEDELTRRYLRPHLINLVERAQEEVQRLRIMDLGCGSADGFELLTGIRQGRADLRHWEIVVLTEEVLGAYTGVDLSADLLDQARTIYGSSPKIEFRQADFCQGLPLGPDERPCDLYFSSYGTFSHFNEDEPMVRLLAEIAQRSEDYCIIVCDWLGRYSYEWQTLWSDDFEENRNMDYVVSYIYEEEERERRRNELEHLRLRLMSREEAEALIGRASEMAGVEIRPLVFFDRSVLTGRHMDTAEYNPHAQPVRRAVNSLHEPNLRTDLNGLLVNYAPKPGFEKINDYFEHLQVCWNALVEYTGCLLDRYDRRKGRFSVRPPAIPGKYPPVLKHMQERMRRVVEGVGWLEEGLPRENIIEPQLGYALRTLVATLQQGRGCAHSLCGILEVDKK